MTRARLWGFDGDLVGNQGRLMAKLPFMTFDGSPRIGAARSVHWNVETGAFLRWLDSPEDAREAGSDLELSEDIPMSPGQLVVLAGPAFAADLDTAGIPLPRDWRSAAAGFRVRCMETGEYERFAFDLARKAMRVFDQKARQAPTGHLDAAACAALRILQGDPQTPSEQRQVRAIHAAEWTNEFNDYHRLVELTALRLRESRDVVQRLVEEYRRIALSAPRPLTTPSFLAELDIDPESLDDPTLPDELRVAIRTLSQAPSAFEPESLAKIARSEECLVCLSSFSDDEAERAGRSLIPQQEELFRFLKGAGLGTVHRRERKLGEITDSTFARSYRALYAFPFVLTPERKDRWGVIPYARHRSIGMLIHVDNHFFKRWQNPPPPAAFRESAGSTRVGASHFKDIGPSPIRITDIRASLEAFFDNMRTGKGRVYYRRDQLAGELFKEMVGVPPLDVLEPVVNRKEVADRFFKRSYGDDRPAEAVAGEWDVFVFDLTDREFAERDKRNEFTTVEIEHGLSVPVGVGFSLLSVPAFAREGGLDRWNRIQAKATEIFQGCADLLEEFGISFGVPAKQARAAERA